MGEILKGKPVADAIKEKIRENLEVLKEKNIFPKLAIVRVGNNPDDISYEKSLINNCGKMDILSQVFELPLDTTTVALKEVIERINKDEEISGVLIFRPLPKHIDYEVIKDSLSVTKDVDSMTGKNLEKIFEGDMSGFKPATSYAALEMIVNNGIELEGKNVVIVNRSMVLGKPLAMMLLNKNATVTICHSKTKNLAEICKRADIVVTALGKAKLFGNEFFNENSICIDVGVSLDKEGNLSGDVDFEAVKDKVAMITPVKGGVGAITTSLLLSQVVNAAFK